MKRILVYSHDTYGLGNIRRMLELSRYIVDHDPDVSILIVSGSPMLHAFRIPARVDYVKLPCLTRARNGAYAVKFLDMGYEEVVRLRRNLILNTFVDFDPDLLIVDKKPLGVSDELEATLELAKRRGHRTRTMLVLRDILDAPESTTEVWRRNRYHEAIQKYYDQILVLGSAAVFDVSTQYCFPAATRGKVRYCGYLARAPGRGFREQLRGELGVAEGERLVLVTVGGGEDGDRVLSCYLDGWHADTRLQAMSVRTLLVCGSEMNDVHRRHVFNASQDSRLIVRDFSDDMMTLMDAADLVVSMGGYNTTCELLTLRKPAIIVPRVRPVAEQWIRAERMAALGLFRVIHPDRLQPSLLMGEVRSELERIEKDGALPSPAIDLRGLARVHDAVRELTADPVHNSGSYPRPALVCV